MARFAKLSGAYAVNDTDQRTQVIDPGLADTLTGILWADAAGALHIEQSTDGTNWDLDTVVNATINTGVAISVAILAPFVRVRYVNGAGAANVRCAVRFTSAGPR
jgi:hypothetical protein